MQQDLSLSVVFLAAVCGCVVPPPPTQVEGKPQPSAEQLATPPPPKKEKAPAPPVGQVAMPAPRPEKEVLGKFNRSDFPTHETYEWVTSPDGIEFLEAVFRLKLENIHLDLARGDFVVLGLYEPDGGIVDPPSALLSRFQDIPNIASSSETYIPNGGRESVEHSGFGGRGRAIIVENLNVIDACTIDVKVRGHAGCMSVSKYRFAWRDGRWVMAERPWSWVT